MGDHTHDSKITKRKFASDLETDAGSEMTNINKAKYGEGDNRPPLAVTQDQFVEFVYWAQMCAATYCPDNIVQGRNDTVLKCGVAGNCKEIEADGWETKYEFKEYVDVVVSFMICYADWRHFYSEGEQGATGLVAVPGRKSNPSKKDIIVLAIRGTQTNRNWAADFDFRDHKEVTWCEGCKTHAGFHGAWDTVRDPVLQVIDDYIDLQQVPYGTWSGKVVVTGHSMGGGVSTVAATDIRLHFKSKDWKIRVDLISYAAPRSTNDALAQFVDAQGANLTTTPSYTEDYNPPPDPNTNNPVSKQVNYRITHIKDIVPKVPMMVNGFRHPGPEVLIKADTMVRPTAQDLAIYLGLENQVAADTEQADLKANGFNESMVVPIHEWYFFGITQCGMCEKDGTDSKGCVTGVAG